MRKPREIRITVLSPKDLIRYGISVDIYNKISNQSARDNRRKMMFCMKVIALYFLMLIITRIESYPPSKSLKIFRNLGDIATSQTIAGKAVRKTYYYSQNLQVCQ